MEEWKLSPDRDGPIPAAQTTASPSRSPTEHGGPPAARERRRSFGGSVTALVCEPDETLHRLVSRHHSIARILSAHDGDEAMWILRKLQSALGQDFLLVISEFSLPKRPGLEICRFVRSLPSLSNVPFLMVASGDDPEIIVQCLNAGADDFLKRPFSPREFESRVGALLRRVERDDRKSSGYPFDRIEKGPLIVDTQRFEVRVHGKIAVLSHKEFQLLVVLVFRIDLVVPYEELLRSVWGEFYVVGRENLKVHIHSLKKKLAGGAMIEVVRGFGYRLKTPS